MKTFPSLRQLWAGFTHLLYPELCVACGGDLPSSATCFCIRCRARLAPSDMHLVQENEFIERLWGRIKLENGAAAYYFTRNSPIRMAIHHLKYKNKPEIGLMIGREFGRKLRESDLFKTVEGIVPVPLHPRKERLRGYNQSTVFAQGLSESMDVPMLGKVLVRRAYTETQTKKKRMERFQNVGEVFAVEKPQSIEGKHLLLVDDVLTTGATLELCGQAMLNVAGTRLSCATIAIASR
ncbi:MAG: ComF family protein [Phycisphaerae bacterium]|nr:ComF family protein [Saprospiraceae bacterium]